MATFCLVTARDLGLFQALDRCPLTVRQILKLSTTFAYPFTTERRVQERLRALRAAGRVRQWPYATAGQGALSYYTLSPLGYRLLHGHDAIARGPGRFKRVGIARQAHTQALAEVIVHLLVAAQKSKIPVVDVRRENTLRLSAGDQSLYPDGAIVLAPEPDLRFTYFLEIDNRTEPIARAGSIYDSWKKKVEFYEKYQDACPERFRVLAVTTGGPERLDHMLRCAAERSHNAQRSLIYGIGLRDLLDVEDAMTTACFRNHLGQAVALLPLQRPLRDTPSWDAVCHETHDEHFALIAR